MPAILVFQKMQEHFIAELVFSSISLSHLQYQGQKELTRRYANLKLCCLSGIIC